MARLTRAWPSASLWFVTVAWFGGCGLAHPRDGLADQPLNGADRPAVDRCNDGYRGACSSGAARAADTMDVVSGMMRYVKIENVGDVRDIEAARGDVRGDKQFDLAAPETFESRHACGLIHVAMKSNRVELMPQQ